MDGTPIIEETGGLKDVEVPQPPAELVPPPVLADKLEAKLDANVQPEAIIANLATGSNLDAAPAAAPNIVAEQGIATETDIGHVGSTVETKPDVPAYQPPDEASWATMSAADRRASIKLYYQGKGNYRFDETGLYEAGYAHSFDAAIETKPAREILTEEAAKELATPLDEGLIANLSSRLSDETYLYSDLHDERESLPSIQDQEARYRKYLADGLISEKLALKQMLTSTERFFVENQLGEPDEIELTRQVLRQRGLNL